MLSEHNIYFDDGSRTVDFILVYNSKRNDDVLSNLVTHTDSAPALPQQGQHSPGQESVVSANKSEICLQPKISIRVSNTDGLGSRNSVSINQETKGVLRTLYELRLVEEGFHLEKDDQALKDIVFVKVHATYPVLAKYAELLKTKMPLKATVKEAVQQWMKQTGEIPASAAIHTDAKRAEKNRFTHWITHHFTYSRKVFPELERKMEISFDDDKDYLFDIPEDDSTGFFCWRVRARIVDYCLRQKMTCNHLDHKHSLSISDLLKYGVYSDAYPIHDGKVKTSSEMELPSVVSALNEFEGKKDKIPTGVGNESNAVSMRQALTTHWASFKKILETQPLDYIRDYFGDRLGMYFAFVGHYALFLLFASIFGIIFTIYGGYHVATSSTDNFFCEEGNRYVMCPRCDNDCDYWTLKDGCGQARLLGLFDHDLAIAFSIIVTLWGVVFLEFWKRFQFQLAVRWHVKHLRRDRYQPRPEYLAKYEIDKIQKEYLNKQKKPAFHAYFNFLTGRTEPKVSLLERTPRFLISALTVLFSLLIVIVMVILILIYNVVVTKEVMKNSFFVDVIGVDLTLSIVAGTGSALNFIFIVIFSLVYRHVGSILTEWEVHRTQIEHDNSLAMKIFLFEFANYFTLLFYIAFFKPYTGRPGSYNRIFGYRLQGCGTGGCLSDLSLSLTIIFVLLQALSIFMQIILPFVMNKVRSFLMRKQKLKDGVSKKPQWLLDYSLQEFNTLSLFDEFLTLILQFAFVTLFVVAFPLAPILALVNNIFEIRTDAFKLTTSYRRPIPLPERGIGIWYQCLQFIVVISIFTNACVIAFTTDFIPRLVFKYYVNHNGTNEEYLPSALSIFNVSDFEPGTAPNHPSAPYVNITTCYYKDYRYPAGHELQYQPTPIWWIVLAMRFIFVLAFQTAVYVLRILVMYFIPDESREIKHRLEQEQFMGNYVVMRAEEDRRHFKSQIKAAILQSARGSEELDPKIFKTGSKSRLISQVSAALLTVPGSVPNETLQQSRVVEGESPNIPL